MYKYFKGTNWNRKGYKNAIVISWSEILVIKCFQME